MTVPSKIFRVRDKADLSRIPFENGMAAIELPAELLGAVALKNDVRGDSPRLRRLARSIRRHGYRPVEPIAVRIGRRGRWIVVNGGHRLTAAQRVMSEWWPNLFGPKVRSFYIVVFSTEASWSKTARPEGAGAQPDAAAAEASRLSWERADARMARLDDTGS